MLFREGSGEPLLCWSTWLGRRARADAVSNHATQGEKNEQYGHHRVDD